MMRNTAIAFMPKEKSSNYIESLKEYFRTSVQWFETTPVVIFVAISMAFLDAMVLFDVLDTAISGQSVKLGQIVSMGLALILNFLPLAMAKLCHQVIYKTEPNAIVFLVIAILAFTILYTGTVTIRVAYMDEFYGTTTVLQQTYDEDSGMMLITEETEHNHERAVATTFLLALEPLATSLLSFVLAFIGTDDRKNRYKYLLRRDREIDRQLCEFNAYMEIHPTTESEIFDQLDSIDYNQLKALEDQLDASADYLKQRARYLLAEYLKDPQKTSLILGKEAA